MKKNMFILLCLLSCLAACNDAGLDTDAPAGRPIYLRADVDEAPQTRSPYMPLDKDDNMLDHPTGDYPLLTDVWGSTTPYVFKEETDASGKPYDGSGADGKVAIHTDAKFQSGNPQLLRSAIYNESTKPTVYFVAFAPMSSAGEAWTTTDGTSASYTFNGNDDVLFAPQVQGTYAQDFSNSPLLHFRHLLTWIRIEIKAESEAVSNSWGLLKDIKITSKNKVDVNLKANAYDADGEYVFSDENIVFSGETDMNLYQTEEEEVYEGSGVQMKTVFTDKVFPVKEELVPYKALKEVAYVLCSPVTATETTVVDGKDVASAEYTLKIVTEKRNVNIPIDLHSAAGQPYIGSTRCKQFTILLNFKMGNTVYVATSVSDWKAGGIVTEDMGDEDIK